MAQAHVSAFEITGLPTSTPCQSFPVYRTSFQRGKGARALHSPRLFFTVFVVFSGVLKPSRKKARRQKMDAEEYRKALLTRVRKVTTWNVEKIASYIVDTHPDKIKDYVNGSDADIHALIAEMNKSMKPGAVLPEVEFPIPSWNSQAQSSDTFEGIQSASAGQTGTSQLPGSTSVPDDGMRDFLAPSWNSQAQSSSTSVGIQSATTGQTVTLQIPDDKPTGLKSSSV